MSQAIPGDQTLVIQGVPVDKTEVIKGALSRSGLYERNNPRFVENKFGPHLLCFANYKSKAECQDGELRMQRWLSERQWASNVHVYVKQNGFRCKAVCRCRPRPGATSQMAGVHLDQSIEVLPGRIGAVATAADGPQGYAATPAFRDIPGNEMLTSGEGIHPSHADQIHSEWDEAEAIKQLFSLFDPNAARKESTSRKLGFHA